LGEEKVEKREEQMFLLLRQKKKWMEEVRFKTRNERRNESRGRKKNSPYFS